MNADVLYKAYLLLDKKVRCHPPFVQFIGRKNMDSVQFKSYSLAVYRENKNEDLVTFPFRFLFFILSLAVNLILSAFLSPKEGK